MTSFSFVWDAHNTAHACCTIQSTTRIRFCLWFPVFNMFCSFLSISQSEVKARPCVIFTQAGSTFLADVFRFDKYEKTRNLSDGSFCGLNCFCQWMPDFKKNKVQNPKCTIRCVKQTAPGGTAESIEFWKVCQVWVELCLHFNLPFVPFLNKE